MIASRRPHCWVRIVAPPCLLVLLWLLFFWRILTPNEADRLTFQHGDFTLQFLAYRQLAYRQLAEGRFPVIEECLYSGHPFQADPQSQVLYPPVLATLLLGRALGWSAYPLRALEWEVMLHVLWAALGMYVFLRAVQTPYGMPGSTPGGMPVHRLAALIGAVAFAFGGFLTGYAMLQTAILQTAAWLPLIMLALNRLAVSLRWGSAAAALAVLVFFAFTAGHPQTMLLIAYAGIAAFVYWSWSSRRASGWPARRIVLSMIGRGGLAAVCIVGLVAAQLLPSLLFTLASTRATLSFDAAGRGFALYDIALFALTGVINVWQPIYIGIIGLALAIGAIIGRASLRRTSSRRDIWLWVGVGVGALILSFGANAAGFDLAYLLAPGYRQFQAQERHAVIVTFALAVLAAYGAHRMLGPLRMRALVGLRRTARGMAIWGAVAFTALIGALVSALVAQRLSGASPSDDAALLNSRLALIVFGLLGTAALLAWRSRLGRTPRWAWGGAVLGLLVLDLFSANRFTATQPPADPFPPNALIAPIQDTYSPNSYARVYNHFGLPLNAACIAGLSEVGGGSPIAMRDYKALLERAPEDVMIKLLNARYAVTWRGAMETPQGVMIPWFLLARDQFEGRQASTYRLDWEPRQFNGAWIAADIQIPSDMDEMLARMYQQGYDPFTTAFVLKDQASVLSSRTPNASFPYGTGTAGVEGKATGYIKVAAHADGPALLVVSEAYHWNWVALVNGREVLPVPVNGALLGVPIPAGASTVEFSYRPLDLYIGAAISTLTGLAIATALAVMHLRSRQARQNRR